MNDIKHRFVALDYMHGRLHHVDESNPAANWSVPSGGMLQDVQLAGAGRLIVSLDDGWSFRRLADGGEVGRVKTGVTGIATLCLLPGGGVLAGLNTPAGIELVEFDDQGQAGRTYAFHEFKDLRQLRRSSAGTWLFAHHDGAVEVELAGAQSRVLRSFTVPGAQYAYQLVRKADGHYRFSGGYAKGNFELAADGRCLRAFAVTQPPGLESYFYSGFQLLANGHVVQANWNGHNDSDYRHGLKLFEFDGEGNTVWSWIAPQEQVGSITAFIILDGLDPALPHDDASGIMEPMLTWEPPFEERRFPNPPSNLFVA